MKKYFTAFEFDRDEQFHLVNYSYQGDENFGWSVFRNDELILKLGKGYRILKSLYCGICSTDIARAKLPFVLPQITGHELIALQNGAPVLVEINASHKARAVDHSDCPYCRNDMEIHCPERLTLGIDRLPGGFSPYVLSPVNSIVNLPNNIDPLLASITEPFAAALHAVTSENIEDQWRVAVVGPRRLGSLLILALDLYRKKNNLNYSIHAVIRNSQLIPLCLQAGADDVVLSSDIEHQKYDLVYDVSGAVEGFKLALQICKKILHVKSTHGMTVEGLSKLTEIVIDELTLSALVKNKLSVITEAVNNNGLQYILIDTQVPQAIVNLLKQHLPNIKIRQHDLSHYINDTKSVPKSDNEFKKYDAVCVSSLNMLNSIIRNNDNESLIRARGHIYWYQSESGGSLLEQALFQRNISMHTSRCGKFENALTMMSEYQSRFEDFAKRFITHTDSVSELNKMFEIARSDRRCIKAVVKHEV